MTPPGSTHPAGARPDRLGDQRGLPRVTHGYPDGGPRLARRWRSQAGRALDPETLGLLASIGIERGELLDGSKTYKVHLLPNLSAKDFWSFTLYDNQTRSMLQTAQRFSSVNSMDKGIVANPDGSVNVWFGPTLPKGVSKLNWAQTNPGKGWNLLFRLYGPLEPWFDKTWRPGEFELVKQAKPIEHRESRTVDTPVLRAFVCDGGVLQSGYSLAIARHGRAALVCGRTAVLDKTTWTATARSPIRANPEESRSPLEGRSR